MLTEIQHFQDFTNDHSLSRKEEEHLQINLVQPNGEDLKALEEEIYILAQNLNNVPIIIKPFTRGFLPTVLTPEQEAKAGLALHEKYAASGVELQDKLTNIRVHENNERMVDISYLFQENGIPISLSTIPFNAACGDWANKPRVFWVREGVVTKLVKAGYALSKIGLQMHVEDCFRPIGVQEGLFFRRIQLILKEHPEWANNWDLVWQEARSKTAISPLMAGHKSGAAIDITLQKFSGEPLPLGNKYPDGGPKVAMHYPYVTQEEWRTRQLFFASMEMAGLRIYPYENWHASFGDLSAGIQRGSFTKATPNYETVYGPIKNFDPRTGQIDPYDSEDYYKPFFTPEELQAFILGK